MTLLVRITDPGKSDTGGADSTQIVHPDGASKLVSRHCALAADGMREGAVV